MCFLMVKFDFNKKAVNVTSRKEEKWQYVVVVVLILLAGLRNRVGGDTINYESHFVDYPNLWELFRSKSWWEELSQPIWFLINVALKTIWDDFLIVQFFHAVIVNCLLYRFIRRSTTKEFTVYAVMFCILWWNFNFEILRESLCVALFLNGLLCLKQGKVGKYLLWCLPALGIHYFSFVIVGIVLVFYYINNTVSYFVVILSVLFLLFINTGNLSDWMVMMSLLSGDASEETMEKYIYGDKFGTTSLNFFGIVLFLITLVLPVIVAIKHNNGAFMKRMILLFIIIAIFQAKFPIISRFANYLWPVLIVEAINYLYAVRIKSIYSLAVLCLLLYNVGHFTISFYRPFDSQTGLSYDCRYIPYTSVFQDPNPVRERYYGK